MLSCEQARSGQAASLCCDSHCYCVEVNMESVCMVGLMYRSLYMQVDDTDDRALRKYRVLGKHKMCLVVCEDNE